MRLTLRRLIAHWRVDVPLLVTMALVMSLAIVLFAVTDRLFLQPLPFSDPDGRLVHVHAPLRTFAARSLAERAAFAQIVKAQQVFEDGAMVTGGTGIFLDGSEPTRSWNLRPVRVSPEFFRLFPPAFGRPLLEHDRPPDAVRSMVVSHDVWVQAFGASTDILSRPFLIPGTIASPRYQPSAWQIVGVMPQGFALPTGANVWVTEDVIFNFTVDGLPTFARLKSGVTAQRAAAALPGIEVAPIVDYVRPPGAMAAIFLCLAACLAVASVWLQAAGVLGIRATVHSSDIQVRLALGGSRAQAVRPSLLAGALYALTGGIAGIAVLPGIAALVLYLLPPELGLTDSDWRTSRVAAFTAALVGLQILILALVPAAMASGALRGGHPGVPTRSARSAMARRLLLTCHVAATVMLGYAAAIAWHRAAEVVRVDTGFDATHLYAARLPLAAPSSGATIEDRMAASGESRTVYRLALQQVLALPGVQSAALAGRRPMQFPGLEVAVTSPESLPAATIESRVHSVSHGYMTTIGGRIVEGRGFSAADPVLDVAVINEAMAARLRPLGPVIGARLLVTPVQPVVIIGVVRNITHQRLDEPPIPEVFRLGHGSTQMLVRFHSRATRTDQEAVLGTLRSYWGSRAPTTLEPIATNVRAAALPFISQQALLSALAIGASIVLVVGLLTAVQLAIALRRTELAIRQALGARRHDIRRCVGTEAMTEIAVGAVLGTTVSLLLGKLLIGDTIAVMPSMFLGVGVITALAALAWLAIEIPVRRFADAPSFAVLKDGDR